MRPVESLVPARLGAGFRWLLSAAVITNLGDGIALAAGPLLVASQTHDPFLVALAPVLQRLPWLLVGLWAGVVADRVDRRRLLVAANLVRVAILAGLLATILTATVSIAVVLIAVFALGVAETFQDITSSTLPPMLVAPADLGLANARLLSGYVTANQLAGPPIGAFLFATAMATPFAVQAACVALGAVLVSRITLSTPSSRADRPNEKDPDGEAQVRRVRTDIVDGLRWVRHHRAVRTLALTILSFNITYGAAWSVLVLYATRHLQMGEVGFGLLTTATAVGGIVGTAVYARLERAVSLATIMRVGLTIETLTHLVLAVTSSAAVALVVMVAFGMHAFVWATTASAVRQRAVPTELQGRVSSVYMISVFAGMVAGGLLGGVIARQWGILAPFWFGFVGSALILALIWRELGHIAHADEARRAAT